MSRTADVVLDDGTVAVVKTAEGAAIPALRDEGHRLAAARHPGVVEVIRSSGDADRWELCLAHAGRPASLLRASAPEQVAAIVGAAASTLADLHDRGIVHGHLEARHLLVGSAGVVRLCGFGADPGDAGPADDVAALGAVLVELLGDHEALEPMPDQRWNRRRPWPGVARRSLLAVADLACAEPADHRPTARRLATTIADAVPSPRRRATSPLQGRSTHPVRISHRKRAATDPTEPPSSSPPRQPSAGPARRWLPLLAASMGVALVVTASAQIIDGSEPPSGRPTPLGAEEPACVVVEPEDGCQPIEIDGTSVRIGSVRFEVGQPGDQVIAVDWDCDGSPSPAVLRPSTGEVFLFPSWATGQPIAVTAATVVPDARTIHPSTATCGPPVVERADGTTVPIPGGPTT